LQSVLLSEGVWLSDGRGLTVRDIAKAVGARYWRIYRLARSGMFGPPTRVGNAHFFAAARVRAALPTKAGLLSAD
jgi:hypothetical protein